VKILICPYNWFHQKEGTGISGGERYLERLCNHLLSQGHEIKAVVGSKEPYTHNGIECYPQGINHDIFMTNNEHFRWCDIVIGQLMGDPLAFNKCNQHSKPYIYIAHNNSKHYSARFCRQDMCHVIYNSYQLRDDLFSTFGHFNGFVLHPLLSSFERKTGDKVTLVNLNHNKGGHQFIELAKRLPHVQFLGVEGGYGLQIKEQLPNVTYLPNGSDMNEVYAQTKILLVLSEFESFSQCATEAMQCGIPVIAHPTPGLKENLSNAGIFISRDDIDKVANKILSLVNSKEQWQAQSDLSFNRAANVSEKSKEELVKFDSWFNKIK
jgi:hypothetical protein